jgi:hypothetical protein
MPHFYLEGFENDWQLIRETPHSQKFRVKTPDSHELAIDIHYTMEKVFKGNEDTEVSKHILNPVFDELARIARNRGDYTVIDYTLATSKNLADGNYSILN